MNLSSVPNRRGLGFHGLRSVIAYLKSNPTKTHFLAVKEANGIHDIVVTPQSLRRVVAQLRKRLVHSRGDAREEVSLLQTL